MNRLNEMTIIKNIKNKIRYPSGIIYMLSVICMISPILFMDTLLADTDVEDTTAQETTKAEDKKDSWLDGSWIPQSVQIHGFLSQGFVRTTDNNFFGESANNASFDYREIGLNGSWRVIPELQLSMQIVYRDAGLTDEEGVRIDYGFADYSFYSTESTLLGMKGGRVPTPLGFYNETRDVLSTRPTILLPQSIYFDRNRNIALSADGGYFYGEQRTEYGDFFFDIGGVVPRTDDADAKFSITGNLPGEFEGNPSWVGRLAYEWQSGRVRMSVTYGDFYTQYNPEQIPGQFNLQPGTLRFNPLIFSAQYNGENWSLTGEYELRRTRLEDFGFPVPNSDRTGIGYYIQGTYKFTSWMEGVVRYDDLVLDMNDKSGANFQSLTNRPAHSQFAQDWTFGLRFTIIPSLLFSAEYHRVNGTAWLASIENPDPSKTKQRWDMYLMMISYDF